MDTVTITGLKGIPNINEGDNLSDIILKAVSDQGLTIVTGDIIVITSKIVSKAEGRIVKLENIKPSDSSLQLSKIQSSDPKKIEVILSEAKRIVRMVKGLIIIETPQGFVCANGGVDASNIDSGSLVLLPKNADKTAQKMVLIIKKKIGVDVAIIVSDTFGRPWREGQTNVAIGVAGLLPLKSYVGSTDPYGNLLKVTNIAIADELASASELVMGKLDKIPVAIIRGYKYESGNGSARKLIRPISRDLFR